MKKMTDYRSRGSYFTLYDLQSHQKLLPLPALASVLQSASLRRAKSTIDLGPAQALCLADNSLASCGDHGEEV